MFLQNLRAKVGARLNGDREAGFTLIELLVVMLILGILAAIALPAFFNQRDKAGDAKAKETVHTVQVAIETYATENGGSYAAADMEALNAIEPTLPEKEEGSLIALSEIEKDKYTIKVTSSTGNSFTLKNVSGALTYSCATEGSGGCPSGGGDWSK